MLTVLLVRAQKEMRSIQNASIILKNTYIITKRLLLENRNSKDPGRYQIEMSNMFLETGGQMNFIIKLQRTYLNWVLLNENLNWEKMNLDI